MSQLNPYESFLDGRPIDAILASTADAIAECLEAIGPNRTSLAAGSRQMERRPRSCATLPIARLSSHSVSARRLPKMGRPSSPSIRRSGPRRYSGVPAAEALAAFSALRNWNLRLIRDAMPGAAGRMMTHPERGTMTFQSVVETMAGHDLNHLGQLRRIAGQASTKA